MGSESSRGEFVSMLRDTLEISKRKAGLSKERVIKNALLETEIGNIEKQQLSKADLPKTANLAEKILNGEFRQIMGVSAFNVYVNALITAHTAGNSTLKKLPEIVG